MQLPMLMGTAAGQLALNDIAPSSATLGTLNAIALTVIAGLRAVVPALYTSIFAIGIKHQIFGGYLVWGFIAGGTLLLNIVLRWLPAKAEGRLKPQHHEE
jgi:hypothetical protein